MLYITLMVGLVLLVLVLPSPVFLWSILLFSTLLTCSIIGTGGGLVYFLVQEVFSWILVFTLSLGYPFLSVFPLVAKLGVPPTHGWFISIIFASPLSTLPWLFSFSKSIPLILWGLSGFSSSLSIFLFFVSLCCSWDVFNPIFLLVPSSGLNMIWISLASWVSLTLFFLWSFTYLFFIYSNLSPSHSGTGGLFNFFMLSGLPPSFLFFLKIVLLVLLSSSSLVLFLLLLSTQMLFCYLRCWEMGMWSLLSSWGGELYTFSLINFFPLIVLLVLLL